MILSSLTGSWVGTNGFRLMPTEPFVEGPAEASVGPAAGGHLTTVAYSWQHPEDGPQEGLVVAGSAGEPGSVVAFWADSWHQYPVPMTLTGKHTPDGRVELEAEYGGGWGWRILFEADSAGLQMRMDNVVPTEHATAEIQAGPYPAMIMDLRRA